MIIPSVARRESEFARRRKELLEECKLAPQIFDTVMPRLDKFMEPFVECFVRSEQVGHAQIFVKGLLSDVKRKNAESIAYRFGQECFPLQWFLGVSKWDHKPLGDELIRQVAQTLGDENGVLVFDPSSFVKSGNESVGVGRQWCGRRGSSAGHGQGSWWCSRRSAPRYCRVRIILWQSRNRIHCRTTYAFLHPHTSGRR